MLPGHRPGFHGTLFCRLSPHVQSLGAQARFPGAHLLAFSRDMLGFVCRLKQEYGDGTPEIRALTPEMRREIQERLEWA